MIDVKLLDEICRAARNFQELHKAGVLSFDFDGNVHVSEDFLERLPREAEEEEIHDVFPYKYKISKHYNGITFFALSEKGGAIR